MDIISLLPDDSLLHILSLLPTKDVLNTSVLSKRWINLWKLVHKLEYMDTDENADHGRFVRFVDRSLLLSKAKVLESLLLKLDRKCSDGDIIFWVKIAAGRGLRELNLDYEYYKIEPTRLPQSLFTCGTLVVLKLKNVSLVDIQFPVCFQLLETLHLEYVIFLDDESPKKLLSSCPVLEVLHLDRADNDNVTIFSVVLPSLQRFIYYERVKLYDSELLMNTPSLKYFKTMVCGSACMIKCLPEIVEAHVELLGYNGDILRSLASVKRFLLCVPTELEFPTGTIFNHLEHLEFCTCETEWDLLICMLQHTPKLRSLKLNEIHGCTVVSGDLGYHWEEPSSVPETLKFVLESFEWRNYRGWKIELELATFILKHSRRLKIATFSPADPTQLRTELRTTVRMKYRLLTELARLSRGSTECELVYG